MVIAALLHDSIEDQEVPREVIAAEFGARVAQVVEEVTDDKSLSKHQRKQRQVETAAEKSREAKILKLADKTSNLTEMAVSPPSDWSVKRRLEYVQWARDVAAGLKGVCPSLEQKFDRAANEATLAAVAQRFTAKEHCNARLFPR